MTPMGPLVIYMPENVVASGVLPMLMSKWASKSAHTRQLNHPRGFLNVSPSATLTAATRGAVRKSAMKTITSTAIRVTSGIIFKN